MAGRAGAIRARLTYAVRRGGPATFNAASAPACSCHRCGRPGRRGGDDRIQAKARVACSSHECRRRRPVHRRLCTLACTPSNEDGGTHSALLRRRGPGGSSREGHSVCGSSHSGARFSRQTATGPGCGTHHGGRPARCPDDPPRQCCTPAGPTGSHARQRRQQDPRARWGAGAFQRHDSALDTRARGERVLRGKEVRSRAVGSGLQ